MVVDASDKAYISCRLCREGVRLYWLGGHQVEVYFPNLTQQTSISGLAKHGR